MSPIDKACVIDYLENFDTYATVRAGNCDFVLVHAGINNFDRSRQLKDYDLSDFIWYKADYSKRYYEDKYLVTGHTPVMSIKDHPSPGHIYKKNGHIAIDCGACFDGGSLAAICLDTGKEYYSK